MARRATTGGKAGKARRRKSTSRKTTRLDSASTLQELRERTHELAESRKQLAEALEQQAATSKVLQVISRSPGDLEPVFQSMLEKAVQICNAKFGILFLSEGDAFRTVALYGAPPAYADVRRREPVIRPGPETAIERASTTKQPVQVIDAQAEPAYYSDPSRTDFLNLTGVRTVIAVPMVKEDGLVGVILIYRQEVRPFTEKQIELFKNFAAQAVIAIENTRLLNELRQRTDDLTESLEQQTATSEVLKVISSSPGDLGPVFSAMLANAVRICGAERGLIYRQQGDVYRIAASCGHSPEFLEIVKQFPIRRDRGSATGRAILERRVVHIHDVLADPEYTWADKLRSVEGMHRTILAVPMLRDSAICGVILIRRTRVEPFTDKQIELVKNFAAQAVIAIENTRLLSELRESLAQQTATADVLKVISRSTFDLQTVLDTLVESARRLCDGYDSVIFLRDGDRLNIRAHDGPLPIGVGWPIGRGWVTGCAVLDGHSTSTTS